MNKKQKLRYVINMYGQKLGKKDLYTGWKKVMRIKNASELSEYTIKHNITTFQMGIKDLEQNPENIEQVKAWLDKKYRNS